MKVAQSCLTLCDLLDYTVCGILQARILEWVDFPFSRGPSRPRDRTQVSRIVGEFLPAEPWGNPIAWKVFYNVFTHFSLCLRFSHFPPLGFPNPPKDKLLDTGWSLDFPHVAAIKLATQSVGDPVKIAVAADFLKLPVCISFCSFLLCLQHLLNLISALCSIWDLSSPTRDQTRAPCVGSAES